MQPYLERTCPRERTNNLQFNEFADQFLDADQKPLGFQSPVLITIVEEPRDLALQQLPDSLIRFKDYVRFRPPYDEYHKAAEARFFACCSGQPASPDFAPCGGAIPTSKPEHLLSQDAVSKLRKVNVTLGDDIALAALYLEQLVMDDKLREHHVPNRSTQLSFGITRGMKEASHWQHVYRRVR